MNRQDILRHLGNVVGKKIPQFEQRNEHLRGHPNAMWPVTALNQVHSLPGLIYRPWEGGKGGKLLY
jgi:hypothetical protein